MYQGELIVADANALGSDNFVWVDHGATLNLASSEASSSSFDFANHMI